MKHGGIETGSLVHCLRWQGCVLSGIGQRTVSTNANMENPSRKPRRYFPTNTLSLSTIKSIPTRKSDLSCLDLSAALRTLIVCHCYREKDEVIRIIYAGRRTVPSETNTIEGGENEKALRFFKSEAEPVCEALKKGSDHADRRLNGRVFRRAF